MSEESKMLPKPVEATPTLKALAPCLRSRSENTQRREPRKVSFPEEESQLVTGYLEPANPWEYAENVNHEDLITTYKASCEKHGTTPLPHVLKQLQSLDMDAVRNECLDLRGEILGSAHCETLEEVLKRVQFKNLNLEATSLDDEGSVALFDMVEYYESATHLNISGNKNIGVRGWQACSRMIKKTRSLEQLEARNVTLNEQFMPILSRALRIGTQLQVLKLENCNLTGRPIIILAAALKLNSGLRELYLADNNLGVTDAIQLGGLLRTNFTLQLLDISNNNIQDTGLGHISDGLTDQTPGQAGNGLSILVLWNNHLTRNASKHFARAVARSQTLETLNIGQNMLTNECLHVMKDSLQQNRTLLRLGMQSTHLTCEGAIALAEFIADNPVIQRIDLRDNNLKVAGLMALALSMKVNSSVTQLDLDSVPKRKMEEDSNTLDQYRGLVSEIRGYCTRNETAAREEEDTVDEGPAAGAPNRGRLSSNTSRKISLTCETLLRTTAMPPQPLVADSGLLAEPRRGSSGRLRSPAPSPIPSPVSSPVPSPSRTRFQVSRVAESSPFLSTGQSGSPTSTSSSPITPPSLSSSPSRFFPSPVNSRFRVTLVESSAPPPLVTSPSGNVTVGFSFKRNEAEATNEAPKAASTPQIQVVNSSAADPAPEIVVTSLSQQQQQQQQQQVPSQSVKVTVKLDPNSDNLIIENESSPSSAGSDQLEDTDDMEVRRIMDPGSTWVSATVQDSVTLVRCSDKDTPTRFPFPDVPASTQASNASDEPLKLTAVLSDSALKHTAPVISEIGPKQIAPVLSETVSTTVAPVVSESVSKQTAPVLPESENISNQVPPVLSESVPKHLGAVLSESAPKVIVPVLSESVSKKIPPVLSESTPKHIAPVLSESVSNQVAPTLSGNVPKHVAPIKSENICNQVATVLTDSVPKQIAPVLSEGVSKQVENNVKTATPSPVIAPAQRTRKISWIAPVEPEEPKPTSSLEKLLGLFHHPGSFFTKSQQQYKATAAIVNPQPVANSNASFLLTAGPLGSIANGGSGITCSSPDTKGGGAPRKASGCENPIPDIINNNSKVQEGGSRRCEGGSAELSTKERRECNRRLCEDENDNVEKSCADVELDGTKSQTGVAVTCSSFEAGGAAATLGISKYSDSKCNSKLTDSGGRVPDVLEKDDIAASLEALKLRDSSETAGDRPEEASPELKTESNAISSPLKSVSCRADSRDQLCVDFANGSPANSDKSWSSFVSVQSAAATVRLVGGASGFSSYEMSSIDMDSQREAGDNGLLIQDHIVEKAVQPSGKEMELLHSNTL